MLDWSQSLQYRHELSFDKIFLKAGEKKTVSIQIDRWALSYYDVNKNAWNADLGSFEVLVGSSSKDIRLKETLVLKK